MIEKRSFQFALSIINLVKILRSKKEYVFADQLIRSATSISANVSEAGAGQSKKDFIAHPKKLEKQDIGYDLLKKER